MKRALAALTVAAFLTLVVDVVGSDRSAVSLVPGAAFALLATAGYAWAADRAGRWPAYLHIALLLAVGYVVFVLSEASVGASLMLVVVVLLVPFAHAGMSMSDGLREGLGLLGAAAFAAVVTTLLVREQEARAELARAHGHLREYAVQAERLATVQERNRVARDIHDGLGHALTVVQMQIKAARAVLETDPARADGVLAKAQVQAEEALAEVRRSVGALRERQPSVPLPAALRALADEVSAAGVPTGVEVTGTQRRLGDDAEESLFRAAQEGLTNVRKHAGATRAELMLDYTRPAAVRLEVRDDGAGVPAAGPPGNGAAAAGFGLVGVRERAAQAGGRMSLESAPGRGATLSVEVPG